MTKKELDTLLINANRIYRYRKDVLADKDLNKLNKARERLKELKVSYKNNKEDFEVLNEFEKINQFLLRIGGKIYPKTFWIDNIEVGLVAIVIIIGIRTFFFQPFIIPTNSMYPTYSGMNEIMHDLNAGPKSFKEKFFNKLLLGSKSYYLTSSSNGRVIIPLFSQAPFSKDANLRKSGVVRFKYIKGKKWFGLIPATFREYTIYVGKDSLKIQVPFDYSLDDVILKTYFNKYNSFQELLNEYHKNNLLNIFEDKRHKLKSNKIVSEGEAIISFDITSGDALFVDRLTYHFRKPKAGDPFVFKTSKMKISSELKRGLGDKYFIKRIAGVEGEVLSIKDGELHVNKKLRDESCVFVKNANREGMYNSYKADGLLDHGNEFKIPENHFFALGDNSYHSHDSRYFGAVSKEAVIGKPCFIYYPFTKRWGLPK